MSQYPNLRGEYLHPTLSQRFLTEGRLSGQLRSDRTARTYRSVYEHLQARYPQLRAREILTVDHVLAWFRIDDSGRERSNWSESTIATYRTAVFSLVRWAAREGVCDDIERTVREGVKIKVRTHRVNNWLEPEDLHRLLKFCDNGKPIGCRDGMVIRVGALSGLRCFELCALRWADVDLRQGLIRVERGKGDKERWVGILGDLEPSLRAWRARAADELGAVPTSHPVLPRLRPDGSLWWDRRAPLTLAQQCEPTAPATGFEGLSEVMVYKLVQEKGQKIGLTNLAPHDLRRTFAGLLESAGLPVQKIAKQLGHSSVDTTVRYLSSAPHHAADDVRGISFGLT